MPFIIPVIEKGALDDTQVKKGQNYYEIAAKSETGAKVSAVLVEDTKTRLLYLSVFDNSSNMSKSLSQIDRPTIHTCVGLPFQFWGQRLASQVCNSILPEVKEELRGAVKKTRETLIQKTDDHKYIRREGAPGDYASTSRRTDRTALRKKRKSGRRRKACTARCMFISALEPTTPVSQAP